MFPSVNSVPSRRIVHAEQIGNGTVCRTLLAPESSHFPHLIVVEFWRIVAAAINHVLHVLKVGSDPKMGRIYTRSIVAIVKQVFSCRNGAVLPLPGKNLSALMVKGAISVRAAEGSPDPAIAPRPLSRCLVHLRPKALLLIAQFADFGSLGLSRSYEKLISAFCQSAFRAGFIGLEMLRIVLNSIFLPTKVALRVVARLVVGSARKVNKRLGRITLRTALFGYDGVSQGVNLHRQVSFWLGSFGASTPCGPFCILTHSRTHKEVYLGWTGRQLAIG